MKDAGDKVPAELRKAIEDKIADVKTAKDNANPSVEAIKKASEALSTEIQKIGQYMKQEAPAGAAGANPAGNSSAGGPEGDVKDAEFKEKK